MIFQGFKNTVQKIRLARFDMIVTLFTLHCKLVPFYDKLYLALCK